MSPRRALTPSNRSWFLLISATLVAACATSPPALVADDAIFVGSPKIYDDYYLQGQLDADRARLAALQLVDQNSIIGHYGAIRGGTLSQTGIGIQALAQATPGVVTVVPTVAGSTGSNFTQTTTQAGLTPSALSPPNSPPQLPTSASPAALDVFNEQMQLSLESANWQLLLDGALSDRFQLHGGGKRHITLGIPITISQPSSGMSDRAAEVEVTICNSDSTSSDADAGDGSDSNDGSNFDKIFEPPSIITLLPLENTYNGLDLTDDEKQLQFGGIAGLFTVSAGFLKANKTYYLAQHQDVVALGRNQRLDVNCGFHKLGKKEADWARKRADKLDVIDVNEAPHDLKAQRLDVLFKDGDTYYRRLPMVTFAWQFRPPLGGHFVKSGLRQNFVQLAIPDANNQCAGRVFVRTRWISTSASTTDASSTNWSELRPGALLFNYDTAPYTRDLRVEDLGDGTVAVKATGAFLPGLRVRVGGNLIDASSSKVFYADTQRIQFVADAKSLVTNKVYLIGVDGHDHELQFWPKDVHHPYGTYDCTAPSNILALGEKLDKPFVEGAPFIQAFKQSLNQIKVLSDTREAFRKAQDQPTAHQLPRIIHVDPADMEVKPYSDTASLVTIRTKVMPQDEGSLKDFRRGVDPWTRKNIGAKYKVDDENNFYLVSLVGGKLFGLGDAPFYERQDSGDSHTLKMVISNDALLTSPTVIVRRLMMGQEYSSGSIAISVLPIQISKTTVASTSKDKVTFAITGAGLGDVSLVVPSVAKLTTSDPDKTQGDSMLPQLQRVDSTLLLVTMSKDVADGTNEIVLQNSHGFRTVVAMPAIPAQAKDSGPAGPSVKKPDPIKVGTTQVILDGANLDKVLSIKYLGQPLGFTVNQKGSIVVALPSPFTATPGVRYLELVATDKTRSNVLVTTTDK